MYNSPPLASHKYTCMEGSTSAPEHEPMDPRPRACQMLNFARHAIFATCFKGSEKTWGGVTKSGTKIGPVQKTSSFYQRVKKVCYNRCNMMAATWWPNGQTFKSTPLHSTNGGSITKCGQNSGGCAGHTQGVKEGAMCKQQCASCSKHEQEYRLCTSFWPTKNFNCLGIVAACDGMASYVASHGTQELKMFHRPK